jgi:hypothetical protein
MSEKRSPPSSKTRGEPALLNKRAKKEDGAAGDSVPPLVFAQLQTERPVAPTVLRSEPVTLVLPSSAAWFSLQGIHQLETEALPEFFASHEGTKTYQDYRDFMVHAYWQRPQHYLSYTACRKNLSGDVGNIMRVHSFLESHGIINYQVTSSCIPTAIPTAGPGATVGASQQVGLSVCLYVCMSVCLSLCVPLLV